MSEILLRAATPDDRPALIDLWVAAWALALPAIDFEARRPWFAARQTELEAEGALTIIAEDVARSAIGFVTLDPVQGYIDQLAVAPSAQGAGVAGRLLAEARRVSPDRLSLDVNQDNSRAMRFYERQGFSKAGSGVNRRSGLPIWRMHWRPAEGAS